MKRILLLTIFILTIFSGSSFSQQGKPGDFTLGNKEFLLNGKPFVIRAAELHYPRIPKEYWEHRIQLSKSMGMNTVCIYLFWNIHEQKLGVFDFTGQNDVAEFVRLVEKNGMYCIVRPGPYVCAEWDMGGLPWWLLKKADIQVRTMNDPYFMERTKMFINQAAKQLAPLQIQNGGNIIMVQVENEYATFGNEQAYMEATRDAVREAGFDKAQLFRCDWSSNFNKYKLDGVATTLNFGAGSNVENQFKVFQEVYPESPLMCSEYWSGWFDHWGRPHETRSISSFIGSMRDMMERKISFSLYMAHGGTTFGQWGGANAPPYSAMATSYDYNAPIGEQGNITDKFYAVRDLLKNYLLPGETLAEIPKPVAGIITVPKFRLTQSASLFENLPKAVKTKDIKPMEEFDQGWGRILYRTTVPEAASKKKLIITELHDWATVFVDGKPIGKLDRKRGDNSVELPEIKSNARLDILVEATGRVNYGKAIIDRKGITEKVEYNDGKNNISLKNWEVYNFPVDYDFQKDKKFKSAKSNGPAWYKGTFNLLKTGDTFLDVSSWGKGMVWVNGYNLGRFWKIGPQQTLYVPGVWLKTGKNEIIILDVDQPSETAVAGLAEPILDRISPDATMLSRKKGEELKLSGEKAVHSGSFPVGEGWKDVKFDQTAQGRYLCFEALSAHDGKNLATMAELDLIDESGAAISRLNWKIIYADSEEITASNSSADKVFDLQETTFWQTQAVGAKPPFPHQVVIDLGGSYQIKGLRYLPRSDKKTDGMIKDYRVYLKADPFRF